MSYVDAIHLKDIVHVAERIDGIRYYREYPADYTFYFGDPKGKHKSVYGDPLSKFSTKHKKEFRSESSRYTGNLWESDIKPLNRILETHYLNQQGPELNIIFFDIETDFDPELGFCSPNDAFNMITAITLYLSWTKQLITLAIPPKSMSKETAEAIADKFDDTFIFYNEVAMLEVFLDLIDDGDVITGWNSEGYDIPYVVNRIVQVMSKNDTRRLCLWNQFPKQREFERYGKAQTTYDLIGRVHLDYLQLYRKYTYHEMYSYSLDAIGEYEIGEKKVAYEGTLDQLYNNNFETFIAYNRQDTFLIYKIDKKLKFIELTNSVAHENTVLLPTTMGAVAVTEQAIINESHQLNLIVPNKKHYNDDDITRAAGAYVAYPKKGLHKWIGSIDINSLYPSTIRALNMGPESVIGQIRQDATNKRIEDFINAEVSHSFAGAWEGQFGSLEYQWIMDRDPNRDVIIDWERGGSDTVSALDAYRIIFEGDQPWTFSANGTIFTYEKKAIIPGLLARWYAERQEMQTNKGAATTEEERAYWDKRQLIKKINLNSLYGAILNQHCRFFDHRIGQSTTLTGRIIAKHMDAFTNECITGKYDYIGDSIIYGDTDSVYFSAWPAVKDDVEAGTLEWNKEVVTKLYDTISDQCNESFPIFMEKACHCPQKLGAIIKGGREISATSGLFITKKRYAAMVYDDDGTRKDVDGSPGKLKAMGLDLKRSDTPPIIQDFLKEILIDLLAGGDKDIIIQKIKDFKTHFAELPSWEKGSPKRVNNLTRYTALYKSNVKSTIPGHVRASINWNILRKMNNDNYSMEIFDGQRIIVCKLKSTPLKMTSVAYPIDEKHIPKWFTSLPFDDELMESTNIDKKLNNLLGVLKWDIIHATDIKSTFGVLFSVV